MTGNTHRRLSTRERLQSIENSAQARASRLRKRLLSIVQISVAAGIAFWAAQEMFGHAAPFFAPISVIIVVGFSGGERIRRAIDMSLGCVIGVLVGDLLFYGLGSSPWQIAIMIAIAMSVASLMTNSVLVSNQVAIGTVLIVTIMPPGAATTGVDRTLDALVGSIIGLVTVALIPTSALAGVRHEVSNVLKLTSSVLSDVALGLNAGDPDGIKDALSHARGSQPYIDAMLTAAKQSKETSSLSPLQWGVRRRLRSIELILSPLDNCVRSARVLARKAHILAADHEDVTREQIALIEELADVALELSEMFAVRSNLHQAEEIPGIMKKLRDLAGRATMEVAGDAPALSNYSVLAQTRSVIVDMLQICGMNRDSAVAQLAPTSGTPALPPEAKTVVTPVQPRLADASSQRDTHVGHSE